MMKAIVYNKYGEADILEPMEMSLPEPKENEVQIRVKAISMNTRDITIRNGAFKLFTGSHFPKLTGADFSGTITKLGGEVGDFKVGDEVFGYVEDLKIGTSAEYISLPQKYLCKKPDTISHEQACTLGCAYLTALQALREKTNLKKAETILIYGASGRVGTAAIQLAKHYGLKVTAVSNSSSKEYCLDLGADDFIAYDQMNVFSMPIKCDIFFKIYSKEGSYYKRAKKLINKNGTFVCLIPNPLFMFYRLFSKPNFAYLLVKIKREDLAFLAHLMAKKIINPFISQSLPLSHMDKAHRLIEEGHVKGKIVVQV